MLALRFLFQAFPDWAERWYSRGFFQGVRWVFDVGLGWLPFPLTYLFFGYLIWHLSKGFYTLVFTKAIPLKKRVFQSIIQVFTFVCGIIALFYALWGFNYNRIPITQQLSIPSITLTEADIKDALEVQTKLVLDLRKSIQPDSSQVIDAAVSSGSTEGAIRSAVVSQLKALGYPTTGAPRGRQPFWDGFLLRFGAAGIYNPFTGECNIDQGLYFLTKPYNLAHEFCHGYGFGDEGTCNFLAYIALEQAQDPFLRYSAAFDFWRELAGAYRHLQPDLYADFRKALPAGLIGDLEAIYRQNDRYPEFFEVFRYKAYDHFLKAQGISEGMQNYSKVIPLVLAWRERR